MQLIVSCSFVFTGLQSPSGQEAWLVMEDRGAEGVHQEDHRIHEGAQGEQGTEMQRFMQLMMRSQMEASERAEARRLEEKREDRRLAEERARRADEKAERAEERTREELVEKKNLSDRQYQQQVDLIEKQVQLSNVAAAMHREEMEASKKRERAIYSVPSWKEGEDLESFLSTAESRLQGGGIRDEEWPALLSAKFSGTTGCVWRDACEEAGGYLAIKDRVLKACGYSAKLAGDVFFGTKVEHLKGRTADQLYQRGAQLLRRLVAPERLSKAAEFSIVRAWICSIIPKKARLILEARVVTKVSELVDALQDHLSLEGDHTEGQAAVFSKASNNDGKGRSYYSEGRSDGRKGSILCFTCGKAGHKAADCWQEKGKGGTGSKAPVGTGGGDNKPIICFNCGEVGHKSPQCTKPKKGQKDKSLRRICGATPKPDDKVVGFVNGVETTIVLDSGAQVSAVPEDMVPEAQKLEETTRVSPFGGEALVLRTAEVVFKIGDLCWTERVALIPKDKGFREEVLYGIGLTTERGVELVRYMNEGKRKSEVRRVTTRAEARNEKKEEEEEARNLIEAKPNITPLLSTRVVGGDGNVVDSEVVASEKNSDLVLSGEKPPVSEEIEGEDWDVFVNEEDSEEEELRGSEMDVGRVSNGSELTEDLLVIPPVREGVSGRKDLKEATLADESLEKWRMAADKNEEGLQWKDGLMYQAVEKNSELVNVVVLPLSFRKKVLKMAHEGLGHLGGRKVKQLIRQRFSWPGLGIDAVKYCRSCPTCQLCSKTKARKAPMVERRILSEPFEVVAMDIVGPIPKGKGGCIYILTLIDMASKWPEAVPLRSTKAAVVAEGLIELISRVGIPLKILTDQGTQFLGSVMTKLCRNLGIEKIHTSPYRPEGNGCIERMHGTLGPMLTKAASLGLDWVTQLPFAMFAIRAAPNRESGFSPFDLVYGHRVRTPLDILYQGWTEIEYIDLDLEEWSEWLKDKMKVWREVYVERLKVASRKRKAGFDKHSVARELEVDNLVLCRLPGMAKKLEESWQGPFRVTEKLNRVNYRVRTGKGRGKVLHVNNLKLFHEREEEVLRLTVLAEDFEEDADRKIKVEGNCDEWDRNVIEELVKEYPAVFSDEPGRTGVCKMKIQTEEAKPVASQPYRVPDRFKEGVRVEIEKLVDLGILVPSFGTWASPIVPVPKPDGSIRICADYRKLNSVTQSDPYYMVTLEEILERVGACAIISKLDLSKGFHQIEVDQEDIDKTAIITPFGKFAYTRMPFGLKNAPAVFQRTMEHVLRSCYKWAAPYMDDVLVFSESVGEHAVEMRKVLSELEKQGLTVKLSKCAFGQKKVEYLGHLIGGGVLAVPSHRATAMANFIRPRTKKQLRSFLGAASYYRKFVAGFARFSSALSPATSLTAPTTVDWTEGRLEAFEGIRVSLINCCVLTIPTLSDNFSLHTDASGQGIGATLNVCREGKELPVAYFSRQLQGAQHRYSATELECLALYKSILHFSHFLVGCKFNVTTDHQALVSLLTSNRLNRRIRGWVINLMDYDFEITYRPGAQHQDADALSRQDWELDPDADVISSDPHPRSGGILLGGDVGIEPHSEKEEETEETGSRKDDQKDMTGSSAEEQ